MLTIFHVALNRQQKTAINKSTGYGRYCVLWEKRKYERHIGICSMDCSENATKLYLFIFIRKRKETNKFLYNPYYEVEFVEGVCFGWRNGGGWCSWLGLAHFDKLLEVPEGFKVEILQISIQI